MKHCIQGYTGILFLCASFNAYSSPLNIDWSLLLGAPPPDSRLHLGLWSKHFSEEKRNNRNELIGFNYHSFTVATLVNSYYKRAYTVGFERYWMLYPLPDDFQYELGYRLGLISGYQGHDVIGIRSLKNSPIIPYVQLFTGLNWHHLGVELSAPNPRVVSIGFYIRF